MAVSAVPLAPALTFLQASYAHLEVSSATSQNQRKKMKPGRARLPMPMRQPDGVVSVLYRRETALLIIRG